MVTANTNRALISGLSSAQSSFSNAVLDNACNQLYSDACAGYESALSDMKAARNGQQALLAGTIITLCANMALVSWARLRLGVWCGLQCRLVDQVIGLCSARVLFHPPKCLGWQKLLAGVVPCMLELVGRGSNWMLGRAWWLPVAAC